MVSAEPNRTRTTKASVTQPWLFRKVARRGRLAEPPRKGGSVGLVAVFGADPRPLLRATGNQRIVDLLRKFITRVRLNSIWNQFDYKSSESRVSHGLHVLHR